MSNFYEVLDVKERLNINDDQFNELCSLVVSTGRAVYPVKVDVDLMILFENIVKISDNLNVSYEASLSLIFAGDFEALSTADISLISAFKAIDLAV